MANETSPSDSGGGLLFCGKCGNKLPPDALFCEMCGERVAAAVPPVPESEPRQPAQPAIRYAGPPAPAKPRREYKPWVVILAGAGSAVVLVGVLVAAYLAVTAAWPIAG